MPAKQLKECSVGALWRERSPLTGRIRESFVRGGIKTRTWRRDRIPGWKLPNHGIQAPGRFCASLRRQSHLLWLLTATLGHDGPCWATHTSISCQGLCCWYTCRRTAPLDIEAFLTMDSSRCRPVFSLDAPNHFRSPFSWVHAPCTSLYGILLLISCLSVLDCELQVKRDLPGI